MKNLTEAIQDLNNPKQELNEAFDILDKMLDDLTKFLLTGDQVSYRNLKSSAEAIRDDETANDRAKYTKIQKVLKRKLETVFEPYLMTKNYKG